MKLHWKDLTINFSHLDKKRLIANWSWLLEEEMTPVMVSSIGDIFLADIYGLIYWLDVGSGELTPVAVNVKEMRAKMADVKTADEWFMLKVVSEIKDSGLKLVKGKLFSYKLLPILGGEYRAKNFQLIDIQVHFDFYGKLHKKLKDLPDGTRVRFSPKNR